MNNFILRNKYLLGLANWLNELQLIGRESRERSKFVSGLSVKIKEIEDLRLELIKEYSTKDEKGNQNIRIENEKQVFDVPQEKIKEINERYLQILEKDFSLEITEDNKSSMNLIRDLIINTNYVFGPKEGTSELEKENKIKQANAYVVWVEAFEKINISD